MKTCLRCGVAKPFTAFYAASNGNAGPDGYRQPCKQCGHREGVRKFYGVDYDELLTRQSGVCAICGSGEVTPGKMLAVDHDHSVHEHGPKRGCPECVRGLLCFKCNIGLGWFELYRQKVTAYIDSVHKQQ